MVGIGMLDLKFGNRGKKSCDLKVENLRADDLKSGYLKAGYLDAGWLEAGHRMADNLRR